MGNELEFRMMEADRLNQEDMKRTAKEKRREVHFPEDRRENFWSLVGLGVIVVPFAFLILKGLFT